LTSSTRTQQNFNVNKSLKESNEGRRDGSQQPFCFPSPVNPISFTACMLTTDGFIDSLLPHTLGADRLETDPCFHTDLSFGGMCQLCLGLIEEQWCMKAVVQGKEKPTERIMAQQTSTQSD
ncbi:hypothetical protein GOODEAATRI_000490, partial [Goodea atripinnis]